MARSTIFYYLLLLFSIYYLEYNKVNQRVALHRVVLPKFRIFLKI